jgi:putative alpha-1,2-mannosidase
LEYKKYWKKDFADLTKDDIDKMPARGMYQGTVWQYRWFVPFIWIKGRNGWREELYFTIRSIFAEDNYNHANQPDLQVPGMYNASTQPWKSQNCNLY